MAPDAMGFRMIVDATITVGNIIEIATIAGGGIVAIALLRGTVLNMKDDIGDMKKELQKVGEVLVRMAVNEQRVTNVEQDVRELRHGRGFITPRSEGGVNGEWP